MAVQSGHQRVAEGNRTLFGTGPCNTILCGLVILTTIVTRLPHPTLQAGRVAAAVFAVVAHCIVAALACVAAARYVAYTGFRTWYVSHHAVSGYFFQIPITIIPIAITIPIPRAT